MSRFRQFAMIFLLVLFAASLSPRFLAPASYEVQFREAPNAAPSVAHPLGTDELGRDLFSRLLYGSQVSLWLAPAAALMATLLAAVIGGVAGWLGGWWERFALGGTDLSLSLPWLFLLLTVRALLPLNVSAWTSVVITFALLGFLGWSQAARVVCAGAKSLRHSEFVLHARATGVSDSRLFFRHVLPNLKPVLAAQFLVSIPIFILAEANLGMLGLGVSEPLPSWGNLLRSLESGALLFENPWRLAPVVLLVLVVSSFQALLPREDLQV
jgi:ABC-type dipeptide/oligopeptide/nickel transport system permease subunit